MNKRFQEIITLAQNGRFTEALKRCDKAIKKKPRDINLILLTASLFAQNGQYEKVKEYCLRCINIEPKNLSALFNLNVACLYLRDYECAIKYALKIIKLDKKNATTYANLGLAYWNIGELESAREHALTALKLDATLATNHNNLGLIYKDLKETEKATSHFKQAFKLNPQLAEAYYNYGITLLASGDEDGENYLEKALSINPKYAEIYNHKGLKLLDSGKATQSIDYFKKAITYKQNYVEAYCNLGNAFMIEHQFEFAESMYRKALEFEPNHAGAYNNLGNALLDQDDFRQHYDEAEQCYLKAIELAPQLDDAYKNLAVCYQGEGRHEKALYYFSIYNERVPDNDVVIAGMASVNERRGEYEQGMALIEPFLQNGNASAEIILAYAKLARYFKHEDKAIEALRGIDDKTIQSRLQVEKYYALGKLSDPKGDADTTFSYYKKANDLELNKFDISADKRTFNELTTYFTKEKIRDLQHSDNTSKLPIFIVGMPRSGTSLAEQILASHPDVYGAGELENIHNIVHKIATELEPKNIYPACLDNMSGSFATQLANDHIEELQKIAPAASYVVDKMPHNFLTLGVINLLFPDATVIQCKRSSIDTCLSIYFQHFNKHHSYSNSLKTLGEYYNLYADLMDHWKKTLDINIIELEYENVIADPESEIRNLLEQCTIEWDPACLKFHENKRTVMTPSYDQVRRPIYTSSVAKWKKYEHLLGDLIDSLGDRAY